MSIYELLKDHQTVTVQSPFNGKVFDIVPYVWEGITLGYGAVEGGKAVPGWQKKQMKGEIEFNCMTAGLTVLSHERID